jgi:hypothetical protein
MFGEELPHRKPTGKQIACLVPKRSEPPLCELAGYFISHSGKRDTVSYSALANSELIGISGYIL